MATLIMMELPSGTNGDPSDREFDRRIAASVRRTFSPPESVDLSFLTAKAEPVADTTSPALASLDSAADTSVELPAKIANGHLRLAIVGLAGVAAWFFVGASTFSMLGPKPTVVAFCAQPLDQMYRDCVRGGFQPYWVCDDEANFASTFRTRQGVALNLQGLPDNSRMVGLSYLGGISRESTSVLATVGDVPVLVFVDRLDRDREILTGRFEEDGLHVTRQVRDGLVFYEVSPFKELHIVPYLLPSLK